MPERPRPTHVGIRVPFNSEADYADAQSRLKAKVQAEGLIQTGPGRATLEVECYETPDGRREWRHILALQWEAQYAQNPKSPLDNVCTVVVGQQLSTTPYVRQAIFTPWLPVVSDTGKGPE